MIATWSGAVAAIPTGWLLCDGTNGTPDLRNKFIYGGYTGFVGVAGGASTVTLTTAQLPAHTHSASSTFTGVNSGSHTHTINDPGHNHLFFSDDGATGSGYTRSVAIAYDAQSGGSGNGGRCVYSKN